MNPSTPSEHGSHVITAKSKAAEVQLAIGCTKIQWNRLLFITSEAGDQLAAPGPDMHWAAWREVPANEQQKLIDNVKKRLADEEISDKSEKSDQLVKAIQWRMAQVIKAKKAKLASKSGVRPAGSSTPSDTKPDGAEGDHSDDEEGGDGDGDV